ncbi:DUF1189 domain-containing protein [Bacillaceae bacterium S4-13-56]
MNIFTQFVKSFYDFKMLSAFRFQKIGKTIGYVFFMMAIATFPFAISFGVSINNMMNSVDTTLNGWPDFEIENNRLVIEGEPSKVEQNGSTFIIDDTGETTSEEFIDESIEGVALLANEMVFLADNEPFQISYKAAAIENISKNEIQDLVDSLQSIKVVAIIIISIGVYLFTTALKFIGISFLGLLGLLIARYQSKTLDYKKLWVLSAYAVTAPTILFAILDSTKVIIPFGFWIYWILSILLLHFIIKKIPTPKRQEETTM